MNWTRIWVNFELMNLITELQYFPSVIFYKNSYEFSNIIFEQYESYQKMSFRNRCIIAGANGLITLSIPLQEGRNQKTIMKEVKIEDSKWQTDHWKSIESCYNKSPWFEFYKDELHKLYSKPFCFLLDWNLACFEWSIRILGLPLVFSLSEIFIKKYNEDVADFRNKILPKNYKDYNTVSYRQVFEDRIGFMPNLSILDLIFCEGKTAKELLSKT